MLEYADNPLRISQAESVRCNTRVYELQRQGIDVIVLSLGEAFFDLPLLPFERLPFPHSYHYSHSRGLPQLRERIAAYYRLYHDVPVDPEHELLVTAGSKAATYFALMSMLGPGDEVIIPQPAWVSYAQQVRLCHAAPVFVPPMTPVETYPRYFTPRTKLLILNNPNNPSGRIFSRCELAMLSELAAARGCTVLADEAYADFAPPGAFHSIAALARASGCFIICNSISKTFGLSGWRIGYAIAPPDLIDRILILNQHIITCAPTILEHYVAEHFDRLLKVTAPQIRALLAVRRVVAGMLDSLALRYMAGAGTFYFFIDITPTSLSSRQFCARLLNEDRISAVPGIGYGPDCDDHIRVSIGAEPLDRIEHALTRIRHLIDITTPSSVGTRAHA